MHLSEVKHLKLALTNKCNGRCITCWHANENPYEDIELSRDIYVQVRDALFKTIDVLEIIAGGELFLYSGIEEILEDSVKYHYRLKLATNGAVISEHQKNLLARLDAELIISLDGSYAELQDLLRVNCSFKRVIESIKFFVSHGKRVYIRTCVSNHNFYDMHDMLALADRLGVNGVKFQSVEYLKSVDQPYRFQKPPVDKAYLKSLKGYKTPYSIRLDYYKKHMQLSSLMVNLSNAFIALKKCSICPNNREFIKVDIDGKVYPCSMDSAPSFGDINQFSLEEILESGDCEMIRQTCKCDKMKRYLRRNS